MRSVKTDSEGHPETDRAKEQDLPEGLETFSATLKNGTVVTIREMTGRDLVYMEEELGDLKETRKSFLLLERLNIGEHKITYEDIERMPFKDIKVISELVSKANGSEEEDPK